MSFVKFFMFHETEHFQVCVEYLLTILKKNDVCNQIFSKRYNSTWWAWCFSRYRSLGVILSGSTEVVDIKPKYSGGDYLRTALYVPPLKSVEESTPFFINTDDLAKNNCNVTWHWDPCNIHENIRTSDRARFLLPLLYRSMHRSPLISIPSSHVFTSTRPIYDAIPHRCIPWPIAHRRIAFCLLSVNALLSVCFLLLVCVTMCAVVLRLLP